MASCTIEPTPAGWQVWRGAVPTPLTQLAIDVRDHVNKYQRGTFAKQTTYNGQTVGVWVGTHTWTYRNGVLVTGICIPGVSLLVPVGSTQGVAGLPAGLGSDPSDLNPDPNAAVFGADDLERTDWQLVTKTAIALCAVGAAFWWGLQHAGRAGAR
jgi:hypothetical protein